jgi:hypothetical protein
VSIQALFTQTATVETFLGSLASVDSYSAAVPVPCFVDDGLQIVQSGQGEVVTSQTRLYASLANASLFTVDSRVTVYGIPHRVKAVHRRDLGLFASANHVEVELV